MLFDTHCHLDRYPNPLDEAGRAERDGVITFVMTALPSHFELGMEHVRQFKRIRLALGLHPLLAAEHFAEVEHFKRLAVDASYIGEVGLDFSRQGAVSRQQQRDVFAQLLDSIADRPRFVSVHARRAESEVLSALCAKGIGPAVFHWYTGPVSLISPILDDGHFFSVNPAMIRSAAGQKVIRLLPKDRILTETDGPYVRVGERPAIPSDVRLVVDYLAQAWRVSPANAEQQVETNTRTVLQGLG